MPYIIDGHNLIPHVPGLSLRAMDDEQQLIEILQEFALRQGKDVEVFFDNAPPGQPRSRRFGRVTARFVRQGLTADDAIRQRLQSLRKATHNWTVVSSDFAVQASARYSGARYISSQVFSDLLMETVAKGESSPGVRPDGITNPDELEKWLKLFGDDGEDSN